VQLHPESLLITALVLIPNLLYLRFPPVNAKKHGNPAGALFFTILERAGQVFSFLLPLFFPLSFSGAPVVAAWTLMGLLLALYYAGWIRFFSSGRDYVLLFRPMIGIPIPMAISPVLLLLLSSVVLGSIWQALAAAVLGVGHITISARENFRVSKLSSA
jgi:hypothetical protein